MKKIVFTFLMSFILLACKNKIKDDSIPSQNWGIRTIHQQKIDDLKTGQSYLSVYSRIYSQTEHKTLNFTSTISMRNINLRDTVYVSKATYHNTKGDVVRTYFDQPIYIAPLETLEIVIGESDQEGGSGGNFVFDWLTDENVKPPFFEAVMISTSVQQGLSFTTQGKDITQ